MFGEADMTVGSTKNYNINGAKFVKGQRVKGEDTYPVILFPTGIPNVKQQWIALLNLTSAL